jgi:LytS/YehU family sensor histidine kinase
MDKEIASQRNIPALILQPLVENAMKHGLYQHIGDVTIDIHVHTGDTETRLQVFNPFDPASVGTSIGTGYGLSSLRRRLFLMYGRKDLVQTEEENQKFCVTLIIPNNESNNH